MTDPFAFTRRRFLAGGALTAAALAARPRLAFALDGDTLVVRGASDIQILDPAFQNGLLEEEVGRALFPSLKPARRRAQPDQLDALCGERN